MSTWVDTNMTHFIIVSTRLNPNTTCVLRELTQDNLRNMLNKQSLLS